MIDGLNFAELARAGAQSLKEYQDAINQLNVFPVPDGDTGTNMRFTIENGLMTAEPCTHLGKYLSALATGMLFGARGNSGVIFSQIFKGISIALKDKPTANACQFAEAFVKGYQTAYEAVVNPTEGTMLTVMREGIDNVFGTITQGMQLKEFLEIFTGSARGVLERTPAMLPLLKSAGVVDSGGMGLVVFFEGSLANHFTSKNDPLAVGSKTRTDMQSAVATESASAYGYCTEFVIQLCENTKFSLEEFKKYLQTAGESIVAIRDRDVVKVHVHTQKPLKVLGTAEEYGEVLNIKIEDMDGQVEKLTPKINKPIAYIAVTHGDGLHEQFVKLGCDVVMDGGRTMNTSTEEFLKVFSKVNAEHIIVLPNNSNIQLAASQAKKLYGRDKIHILDSSSVAEGYFAMAMAQTDSTDFELQLGNMRQGIRGVKTIAITRAARDSQSLNIKCNEGEFIGVSEKNFLFASDDLAETAIKSVGTIPDIEDREVCLLIKGKNVSDETCTHIVNVLSDEFANLDIGVIDGGQEIYDIIIGVAGV